MSDIVRLRIIMQNNYHRMVSKYIKKLNKLEVLRQDIHKGAEARMKKL
jgi:DNA-binding protein H-NS